MKENSIQRPQASSVISKTQVGPEIYDNYFVNGFRL